MKIFFSQLISSLSKFTLHNHYSHFSTTLSSLLSWPLSSTTRVRLRVAHLGLDFASSIGFRLSINPNV
jgi:hypothetical protein